MKTIRLGIVGCAYACAELHRPWLLASPECWDVRGLFDLKRELAEAEAKEFGGNVRAEESLDMSGKSRRRNVRELAFIQFREWSTRGW